MLNMKEESYNFMLELLNKYKKKALYTVVGFIVLYILIYILTPKPVMPAEYKAAIDSLISANKVLIQNQKQLDDDIKIYQEQVGKIDSSIHVIKEKTTIIKEFHHEIIERTSHYDSTQIDSFFKARYKY